MDKREKRIRRIPWTVMAFVGVAAVSLIGCRISGSSLELLPVDRWGFDGPRRISMISFGDEGLTARPIADITRVGPLQIWTPAH